MTAPGTRVGLNQITVDHLDLPTAAAACERAGIRHLGVWRHKLAGVGAERAARVCADHGVAVSSLCRGGRFPAPDRAERRRRVDDTRRALDEAAALGAPVLVLVVGGLANGPTDQDLAGSRAMVTDALEALVPEAEQRGVRLGLEPLHPVFAADRSVLTTLGDAVDLADRFASPWLAVVVDAYHVWWDATVLDGIARAGDRVAGLHVSDWVPLGADVLWSRGLPGDGCIDLPGLVRAVDAAGYRGPVEVEVLDRRLAEHDPDDLLGVLRERVAAMVAAADVPA
ncbi:MAG: sugar phosphate isomerase/epimerase family protein [Kineosporiaceae bacterium]